MGKGPISETSVHSNTDIGASIFVLIFLNNLRRKRKYFLFIFPHMKKRCQPLPPPLLSLSPPNYFGVDLKLAQVQLISPSLLKASCLLGRSLPLLKASWEDLTAVAEL